MSKTLSNQSALLENTNQDVWSLPRLPNYARALEVDAVHADEITEIEFQKEYVEKNRPCLMVGAGKHWPAYDSWNSSAYLKKKIPNTEIYCRSKPYIEYPYMGKRSIRDELEKANLQMSEVMQFHDFVDKAVGESVHLVHFGHIKKGSPLAPMLDDMMGYSFLPKPTGSRLYPPHRALIYRQSYTDWHYHAADETLMTQVAGAKDVVLLPPDPVPWKTLWSIVREQGYYYDLDSVKFPDTLSLQPFRTVVAPGDALYIPVFWWHAVEALGDEFGITVATTFKSPIHINADMTYPGARRLLKRHFFTRKAPFIIGAAAYSAARRISSKYFKFA